MAGSKLTPSPHWIPKTQKANTKRDGKSVGYTPLTTSKTNCFNMSSYYRFLDNGIWRFVSFTKDLETIIYPCCSTPYYELVFTIIFRRNPSFYVSYLILPCIFLSGLSLLVFYLPPDCGEKLTLSITNLLSLVVFQQLIAETMPPTAEENPILGEYCQSF